MAAFGTAAALDRDRAGAAMDAFDGAAMFEPAEQRRDGAARGKPEFDPEILAARHRAGAGVKGANRIEAGALASGEPHHGLKLHARNATLAAMLTVASHAISFRAARKRGNRGRAEAETESENPATPRNMARTAKALWAGLMGGFPR